jgi:phosphoserine phosphatase
MGMKVIFFDCDGTLTKVKSSWEYIHRRLGIWENHADEYQELFRKGLIDYEEFCRRDTLLWKGLALPEVMQIVNQIPYQDGAKETVTALKDMGMFTVIISTGLSFLVERARAELGIDVALSNELLTENGFLTGQTRINVQYEHKGYWVKNILKGLGVDRSSSCAVGDGEGDRAMFEAVGLPIGFNPEPSIRPLLAHSIRDGELPSLVTILGRWGHDKDALSA